MARGLCFLIDGKEVSRTAFDRFFKTLRQTGGWYCEKMSGGGRTGWEAKSPEGVNYRYTATTEGDLHTQELERLP